MLKFGQIVDLDLIERSAPNKYVQAQPASRILAPDASPWGQRSRRGRGPSKSSCIIYIWRERERI